MSGSRPSTLHVGLLKKMDVTWQARDFPALLSAGG